MNVIEPDNDQIIDYRNVALDTVKLLPVENEIIAETIGYWKDGDINRGKTHDNPANFLTSYLTKNQNPHPLGRILASVHRRWNAFGVLEYPYLDLEFWNDHAGFYDRCFFRYPVACVRLHFFALRHIHGQDGLPALPNDATPAECVSQLLLKGKDWSAIRAHFKRTCRKSLEYLGYCVIRPTNSFVVGRTAIRFDNRPADMLPKDIIERLLPQERDGKPFLIVRHACSAKVLSTKLKSLSS
jgi:hypothetical protein